VPTVLLLLMTVLPDAAGASVDFDQHIIPVLTKAGCNTGACHGAAVGRGGFKLSLYGGDPAADYRAIALELQGRRVNLDQPAESLVVLKPTESIAHGGGYRLEDDGAGANLLRQWVRQGASRRPAQPLASFEVSPALFVAEQMGQSLQLAAVAKFSDGTQVDVTEWTVFTAEDPSAVEIDPSTASATLLRRGRHIVVARYLEHVVPVEIMLPLSQTPMESATLARRNFIDDRVLQLLSTLRIPLSGEVSDAAFMRRLTLDLTGRLPTPAELKTFLLTDDDHKREVLIERLLSSAEFTEYWTWQFAKLLRIRPQPGDRQGALAYHHWLQQAIATGMPYDQMARTLLVATGDTHEVGPSNFYRTVGGAREQAEFVSELFMGSRLRCANCHNHPLDRWTQDDYHGLAAIFAKVDAGRVVSLLPNAEITHPRTGEAAVPKIPGQSFLVQAGRDQRAELADWLTAEGNPYFSKAIVNRLWKAMMGRGLIEPTDDLRATNPATHPALLEELSDDFVANHYDLRHTLRTIATSATYALSSDTVPGNEADDRYYSHALMRPLPPEVLLDAISDVTGVSDNFQDQPIGTRAIELVDADVQSDALDVLGRCSREESCETIEIGGGGLPRMLHLLNGPLLNGRLVSTDGRLRELLAAGDSPAEVVEAFYWRALGRAPSATENDYWQEQFTGLAEVELEQALEDFVWSLLTCREFTTNH
jgi:hypothetical protein